MSSWYLRNLRRDRPRGKGGGAGGQGLWWGSQQSRGENLQVGLLSMYHTTCLTNGSSSPRQGEMRGEMCSGLFVFSYKILFFNLHLEACFQKAFRILFKTLENYEPKTMVPGSGYGSESLEAWEQIPGASIPDLLNWNLCGRGSEIWFGFGLGLVFRNHLPR